MTFQFKKPVYAGDTVTCHWGRQWRRARGMTSLE
ncbi:hypothetical protein U724_20635 [Pseudomonas chlororaphis subsp. aurantiaca PB-St2]|nr:hypothetical protein U724_20635 [Pseudomonas chlororaphis subsp. aurantiaca PB-St2]